MNGVSSWDRLLDRASSVIYQNSVRLHRAEHERMARRAAAALQFRERLADLKERIARKRAVAAQTSSAAGCDKRSTRAA
jgi:hypothetical protein